MRKEITFCWEAEKRIRIAKAGEKNALFYEAYRQALAGVAEIVRASIIYSGSSSHDPFFPEAKWDQKLSATVANYRTSGGVADSFTRFNDEYLYDYSNNIIVFSGERGAGKSSAMLTFVNSLKDRDGLLFQKDFLSGMVACELPNADLDAVTNMLHKCRFLDLSPIDPTTLEENGQVLTVILARMFRLAANAWENEETSFRQKSSPSRIESRNQLIQQFSTCYEHVQALKRGGQPKFEYDSLDVLSELGDSSQLKGELAKLVRGLLEFCLPNCGDSSYLVLQIDDTDMNIKQAYAILEDIRRYLLIPRLIIVMAADLSHLTQVVESSLLQNYDESLSDRQAYVEKITHQYITKLFPQTRQINLPSLGTYFKEHTENITIKYQTPKGPILPHEEDSKFPNPQDQIFRLIYRKTGLVFLGREHQLHPIIPCNMRLLAHFLSVLVQMEDVEKPDNAEPSFFLKKPNTPYTSRIHADKLRIRLQNVQRFRSYFLTSWVPNSLSLQYAQLFSDLERTSVSDRVRRICIELYEQTKTERKGLQYTNMMAMCREIDESPQSEDLKLLSFALQAYCSLLAHTLALEDLVDYYDRYAKMIEDEEKARKDESFDSNQNDGENQYPPPSPSLGCSFFRLHMLFGSRLFPYPKESENQELFIEALPSSTNHDPTSSGKKAIKLFWATRSLPTFSIADNDIRPALLYSMLMDYQYPDSTDSYWFDLTKPITNCLYLGDGNEQTPLFKALFGNISLQVGGPRSSQNIISVDDWHSMGNSALTTILNCDVQMRMGRALLKEIRNFDSRKAQKNGGTGADSGAGNSDQKLSEAGSGGTTASGGESISYAEWFLCVQNLYSIMSNSLGAAPPIEFLKYISFQRWMEPLKGIFSGTEEAPKNWEEILNKLNADISFKPVPIQPIENGTSEETDTDSGTSEETDTDSGTFEETDTDSGTSREADADSGTSGEIATGSGSGGDSPQGGVGKVTSTKEINKINSTKSEAT